MKKSEYQKKDSSTTTTTSRTMTNSQTNTPVNRVAVQRKRERAESDVIFTQQNKSNRGISNNVVKPFNKNPSSSNLM